MTVTITPEQARDRYGANTGTLANLRSKKQGPAFFRVGRKVFYRVEDFEAWLFGCPVKTLESVRAEAK